MTLAWIVLASFAGGALSVCAAAFALVLRASWVPMLVSFAIGTLLGAAFLEVIPHAFEQGEPHQAASAILGGILGFFLLEKLLLWRHSHEHGGEEAPLHHHEHSRAGLLIVAHEIPQEVGDFLVLLHSGYSKARAFAMNLLSSFGTLVGGLLGYFTLQGFEDWEPTLLGIVAASMIYVAVADLIPGLHKRPELRATASQALLIALGVAVIALARVVVSGGH